MQGQLGLNPKRLNKRALLAEFETFNLSRHATDEMKSVVKMMIELIEMDY